MFDKLKRKFILMNMALLTTVFICILGTIYATTAVNMNRDIERDLSKEINENIEMNADFKDFKHMRDKPKMHDSVHVILDEDNKIIKSFSDNNLEISNIEDLVKIALKNEDNSGRIEVNGTIYSYLKKNRPNGLELVLIDRSNYSTVMLQLLKTLTFVGTASILILFGISVYLTNKFILPIKDAFEKQKRFIADASHELRTPLTIINTNASVILSNPNDTVQNQKRWINYITSQTNRMSGLINEMLSLAKLDIEENPVTHSSINLSKIIDSMLLEFEAVVFENGFSLETNIENDLFISGDTNSIKKLFSILMDNAIKHTNANGKILVDLKANKNKIILKITNTGNGIPKEHLDKIFERFYRVDDSRVRETGGYGLGLSIAKSIITQHKGKIYAQSNVGTDTTFIVELPHHQKL